MYTERRKVMEEYYNETGKRIRRYDYDEIRKFAVPHTC